MIKYHGDRNYGKHAYLIEEKYGKYGYLTLTDQFRTQVSSLSFPRRETKAILTKYKLQPADYANLVYYSFKDKNDRAPIFSFEDMRIAIGLATIKLLRISESFYGLNKTKLQDMFLETSYEELAYLFEHFFNLEYHIPRHIVAKKGIYRHYKLPTPIQIKLNSLKTRIFSSIKRIFARLKRK